MYGYIYETTCIPTGKKYIGMHKWSKDTLDPNYIGSGKLLTKAINKYGFDSFSCKLLEACDSLDELNEAEKYWIKYYNAVESMNYYNIANGGEGHTCEPWNKGKHVPINENSAKALEYGRHLPASEKQKKQLAERRRNIQVTNETREKLRNKQLGKKCINDGKIAKYISETDLEYYLNSGWKLGHLPKDRTDRIEKFKITHYNKDNTEWKQNLSKANKGKRWVTNGIIDKQIKPEELDNYLSIGFRLGRSKARG